MSRMSLASESLPEKPVFDLAYTREVWRNTRGGTAVDELQLDKAHVEMSWAFSPRSRIFVHGLYTGGASPTDELISDLQTISNIDAPEAARVLEAWFEHRLGQRGSVRVGLYDLNSEFDALETAGLFINSSHGIGPDLSQSGRNGPSIFPVTGLALRMHATLTDDTKVRVAVLDAVPGDPDSAGSHSMALSSDEGSLWVAELDTSVNQATRAIAGAWFYSVKERTLLAGSGRSADERARAAGAYVGIEGTLRSDVHGFVRIGRASEAVHMLRSYVGAGVVWQSAMLLRPLFGLAVAHARTGADYRAQSRLSGTPSDSSETAIELTARVELAHGVALQPDVQYIVNPGADPRLGDALALGLRLEWSWPKE